MKVLVVDDTQISLRILADMVSSIGENVVKATNGEEAVRIFENSEIGEFQMIITDINMPTMNGYEEAKAIRQMDRPDATTITIIGVSADESLSVSQCCLDSGINLYIRKSFLDDELPLAIRKYKTGRNDSNNE